MRNRAMTLILFVLFSGTPVFAAQQEGVKAMLARHAAANHVPLALADAVVRLESRYNPRARNRANLGLTQISLATAKSLGYAGSAAGLLDADTNLTYGIKYLAAAHRLAGGETCGTIMRYQSGLGARQMSGANRAYCGKVRQLIASRVILRS